MSEESKKGDENKKIDFIGEEVETIFTDAVQISHSQEAVALELSLRSKDNKTAKITHKVYMTVPHFIRFANVCKGIADNLVTQIEEEENGSS